MSLPFKYYISFTIRSELGLIKDCEFQLIQDDYERFKRMIRMMGKEVDMKSEEGK